jgi:hypothetical protein
MQMLKLPQYRQPQQNQAGKGEIWKEIGAAGY